MKKLLAGALTATMLFSSMTALAVDYGAEYQKLPTPQTVQKFSDVPSTHWAFDYIGEMAQRNVISGYPDGRFIPENQVTRAEFAKIMVCAAGLRVNNNNTTSFNDVYTSDWYCPYVECAKDYLTGYTTNTGTIYKPTTPALREDIAVALVKLKGYDISLADESILNMFTDSYSISSSARKYVAVAVERGIVSGYEDNTFRGQATITRAEAATLLWRAFQYGNDNKVVDTGNTISQTNAPTVSQPQPDNKTTQGNDKTNTNGTQTDGNISVPDNNPVNNNNTPDTTPEPTEKPYKVDTLVKADEFSLDDRMYAFDGKNTIYYANHNTIYAVDINTSTTSIVLLSDKLTIDNDEMLLDNFYIQNIFYNNSRKALYVNGFYMGVNTANDIKNNYLYRVNYDDTVEFVTDDWSYTHGDATGMLDNSKIIWGIEYIQVDDYVYTYPTTWGTNNGCLNKQEADSYIENGDGDHKPENVVFKLNSDCAGFTADSVITATDEGTFTAYNFKGKELYTITADDYEILDSNRSKLNMSDIHRLMITPSNNIIFYDTNAKAFRMISENK